MNPEVLLGRADHCCEPKAECFRDHWKSATKRGKVSTSEQKDVGAAMKPTRASASNALTHMLLGGFVFWAPNVLVHWLRASRFSNFDVIGLTLLLPATTYLFFQMVWWPRRNRYDRLSPALFAVLGIWIIGPSMLTLSLIFCDRLSRSDAWHFFTIGTLLFPLFTFLMSTYDGSVFAVFLTTLVLPIFANARLRSSAP